MLKKNAEQNPAHETERKALRRIAGQVGGIEAMIEDRRYCLDIVVQLRAARAALKRVEKNILKTHLSHCVAESLQGGNPKQAQQKIEELGKIFEKMGE